MIICICNNISDNDLTLEELYTKVKERPKCGQCIKYLRRMRSEHKPSDEERSRDVREIYKGDS